MTREISMDPSPLVDWIFAMLALGAVLFLLYGAWLVFDLCFPRRPTPEVKGIEHSPDEVPHH